MPADAGLLGPLLHAPLLLLALAGALAGAMNSVAGGGSFVTFPALVAAGLPPVVANATSTVALLPGGLAGAYAFRHDRVPLGAAPLRALLAASLLGGLLGAVLLLAAPARAFTAVVPWLLLLATLALAFARPAGAWLRARVSVGPRGLVALQFVLAVYGGYFGGAVGLMMLAAWGLLEGAEPKATNPLRALLTPVSNLAAVALFVGTDLSGAGAVAWGPGLALMAGALAGGLLGARLARRLPAPLVRGAALVIAVAVTAWFFVRE